MIARLKNRKQFCLLMFFLSAALLAALPVICTPGRLPSAAWSLAALVAVWCLFHLAQYLGMVALWAWLADIATAPIRGRYFGRRQRWMIAGSIGAAIFAGAFVWAFGRWLPDLPRTRPYELMTLLGAGFMFAALWPMFLTPDCTGKKTIRHSKDAASGVTAGLSDSAKNMWLTPFADARFRRMLFFGCMFSLVNGLTQSAQNYFPIHTLGVSLFVMLTLQTAMNVGQWAASPWLGREADRRGNRPVMFCCQLLVAAGMLFYAAATVGRWEWIAGAWIFWIAYAGLNVCLPNLTLKLASPGGAAAYAAAFYAAGGFCYAVGSIVGGAAVDRFAGSHFSLLPFFTALFLFGWLARSAVAALILWIVEPSKNDPA